MSFLTFNIMIHWFSGGSHIYNSFHCRIVSGSVLFPLCYWLFYMASLFPFLICVLAVCSSFIQACYECFILLSFLLFFGCFPSPFLVHFLDFSWPFSFLLASFYVFDRLFIRCWSWRFCLCSFYPLWLSFFACAISWFRSYVCFRFLRFYYFFSVP